MTKQSSRFFFAASLGFALLSTAASAAGDIVLSESSGPWSSFATTYSGSADWTFGQSFDLTFTTWVTGSENVSFSFERLGADGLPSEPPSSFSYSLTSASDGYRTYAFKDLDAGTYAFSFTADVGANGMFGSNLSASAAPMAPVPEPETYAMLLAGLGAVGVIARRRLRS